MPVRNRIPRFGFTGITCPVFGLRPTRSFFSRTRKEPKDEIFTASPAISGQFYTPVAANEVVAARLVVGADNGVLTTPGVAATARTLAPAAYAKISGASPRPPSSSCTASSWKRHSFGEALFRKGDEGNAFHIVTQGQVEVWRDGALVATLRDVVAVLEKSAWDTVQAYAQP